VDYKAFMSQIPLGSRLRRNDNEEEGMTNKALHFRKP